MDDVKTSSSLSESNELEFCNALGDEFDCDLLFSKINLRIDSHHF